VFAESHNFRPHHFSNPAGQLGFASSWHSGDGHVRLCGDQVLEQTINRPADAGMSHVAGNFRSGFEHETSDGQPRMRQLQRRRLHDYVVVEEQIEIQRTRAPTDFAFATELILGLNQTLKEFFRPE
jgi:hypothetical protein